MANGDHGSDDESRQAERANSLRPRTEAIVGSINRRSADPSTPPLAQALRRRLSARLTAGAMFGRLGNSTSISERTGLTHSSLGGTQNYGTSLDSAGTSPQNPVHAESSLDQTTATRSGPSSTVPSNGAPETSIDSEAINRCLDLMENNDRGWQECCELALSLMQPLAFRERDTSSPLNERTLGPPTIQSEEYTVRSASVQESRALESSPAWPASDRPTRLLTSPQDRAIVAFRNEGTRWRIGTPIRTGEELGGDNLLVSDPTHYDDDIADTGTWGEEALSEGATSIRPAGYVVLRGAILDHIQMHTGERPENSVGNSIVDDMRARLLTFHDQVIRPFTENPDLSPHKHT